MSDERDLESLQQRLDSAFATTKPRRGFDDELWSRIQARRSFWARLRESLRRVQLAPALGGLAVLAVVVVFGGLLLSRPHATGSTTSGAVGQPAARQGVNNADQNTATFGPLPRPALQSPVASHPPQGATPSTVQRAQYAGPVTVTAVTAGVTLPATAQVARYPEWKAADADRFAAAIGAAPIRDAPLPVGALGAYAGPNFTMLVFATDPARGSEPRVVITPKGPEPAGNPPDDAAAVKAANEYLSAHGVSPDASAKGPTVDRGGALADVRWSRVVGVGLTAVEVGATGLEEGWEATVRGDLTVFQAAAPVPLVMDFANYGVATAQQLTDLARNAGGTGPQVVLDTAQIVYVVATDGTSGYFEPAVMYVGHFSQGGVQYEKRIIVPAVAPNNLR
jgi:hypothetical protein